MNRTRQANQDEAVVVMEMVVRKRFFPKVYDWAQRDQDGLVSAILALMRRERLAEAASAILTLECSIAS
jgi:hypothetical protein